MKRYQPKQWGKVQADKCLLDVCNWLMFCIIVNTDVFLHFTSLLHYDVRMIETEFWESKVERCAELWCLDFTVLFVSVFSNLSSHCHLLYPSLSLVPWVSKNFSCFFTGCVFPCLFLSLSFCIWGEWSSSNCCSLLKAYCNCAPSSSKSLVSFYFLQFCRGKVASVHSIGNGGTYRLQNTFFKLLLQIALSK